MIGDQVFIHRAGEVIPEIISPIIEMRDGSEIRVETPVKCPLCHSNTYKDGDKIALICSGDDCPAKKLGRLEYFVGRAGMNIDGL